MYIARRGCYVSKGKYERNLGNTKGTSETPRNTSHTSISI